MTLKCQLIGLGATCMGLWAWPGLARAERVVYLNFGAQAVNSDNGNDPATNSYQSTSFVPGTLSGLGDASADEQAELLYWFKEAGVPFDIHFTTQRPTTGPYDMLVFGTSADRSALFPDLGCAPAVGLGDCSDSDAENISFMFWGCLAADQQRNWHRIAFSGLTALGFGWGLENVSVSGEVMGIYTLNGLNFGDQCVPLGGSHTCPHNACPTGQQNSSAELSTRIGARIDDGPPVIVDLSPEDGAMIGDSVTVQTHVEDQFGGLEVSLEILEAGQILADPMPPYQWDLAGIPAGAWTLRVHALDADGNEVTRDATVCAGAEPCDFAGSSSTSGGTEATSSDSGASSQTTGVETDTTGVGDTTTGGEGTTGLTTGDSIDGIDPTVIPDSAGALVDGATTGCACSEPTSGSSKYLGLLWLTLTGSWLRRRRRVVT